MSRRTGRQVGTAAKLTDRWPFMVFTVLLEGVERVEQAILELKLAAEKRETGGRGTFTVERGPWDKGSVYVGSHAYRSADGRCLAVAYSPASCPDRTVFVPELQDGWTTLIHTACRNSGLTAFSIRSSADDRGPDYVSDMQVYRAGKSVRHLRVLRDRGYEWWSTGDPLEFEDVDLYAKRRRKDRFNRSVLFGYLLRNGIDVEDPRLWDSDEPVVNVRYSHPWPPPFPPPGRQAASHA